MYRFLITLSFIRKNKTLLISVATIVVLVAFTFFSLLRVEELKQKTELYESQIEKLTTRVGGFEAEHEALKQSNLELTAENVALKTEGGAVLSKNDELTAANEELKKTNDSLAAENDELEKQTDDLSKKIRWVEQAELRPQPQDTFKITFYSTSASYEHLVPGKTIAMNTQQVEDLGLKRGDEIFVKSNKGWSGFYKITDSGCAYGTIDIYVDRSDIPSWGVEYDVTILID